MKTKNFSIINSTRSKNCRLLIRGQIHGEEIDSEIWPSCTFLVDFDVAVGSRVVHGSAPNGCIVGEVSGKTGYGVGGEGNGTAVLFRIAPRTDQNGIRRGTQEKGHTTYAVKGHPRWGFAIARAVVRNSVSSAVKGVSIAGCSIGSRAVRYNLGVISLRIRNASRRDFVELGWLPA